jgi:hypothetical protein
MFFSICFSVNQKETDNIIYSFIDDIVDGLVEYMILYDKLYLSTEDSILLYENKNFYDLNIKDEITREKFKNKIIRRMRISYVGDRYKDKKIPITNGITLEVKYSETQPLYPPKILDIYINDDNIMKISNTTYSYNDLCGGIYIDNINQKLYFAGGEYFKVPIRSAYDINANESNIYVYDIKTKKMSMLIDSLIFNKENEYSRKLLMSPLRIPNTSYLMFAEVERRYKRIKGSSDHVFATIESIPDMANIRIIEVPEWKAEIEQQKKNEKLYPNAKKYLIDGPANVRDNPKGKSITMINDGTEVLVLNQQGDWYEILYANVKGWTYKDNLVDIGVKK